VLSLIYFVDIPTESVYPNNRKRKGNIMSVTEKLENGKSLVDLSVEELDELLAFVDAFVDDAFEEGTTVVKKSASKNAFL
jgi:hypothetical protein